MQNDESIFPTKTYDDATGFSDCLELRTILFEVDRRNFHQLLSEWVKHTGNGDHAAFLKNTGLGKLISTEQLRSMEVDHVPGQRLASIMAMHLPGEYFCADEESSPSLPQLFYAGAGIKQGWAMKRDMKSPHYTTEWADLLKVSVNP